MKIPDPSAVETKSQWIIRLIALLPARLEEGAFNGMDSSCHLSLQENHIVVRWI
jgi:hypothetical protein